MAKMKLSPAVRRFAERLEAMMQRFDTKKNADPLQLLGGCQTEIYGLYFMITKYCDNDGTTSDEHVIDGCVQASLLLMKIASDIVALEKKINSHLE